MQLLNRIAHLWRNALVTAGDHEASVLWHKCADTETYGRNANPVPPLPPSRAIATWIDEGQPLLF